MTATYTTRSNAIRAARKAIEDGRFEIVATEGGFTFQAMAPVVAPAPANAGLASPIAAQIAAAQVDEPADSNEPAAPAEEPTGFQRVRAGLLKAMGFAAGERRFSDALDFQDVAVWTAAEVLERAYAAGVEEGRRERRGKATAARQARAGGPSKREIVAALLTRPEGTTTAEILAATGWPSVSVPAQAKASGLTLTQTRDGRSTRYFGRPA
jgi:hypothetical protein